MQSENEINLETMISEILFIEQTLSIEPDWNDDDQPWAVLINDAIIGEEEDGGVYRGESIYAAVCLAYNSIVGA